MLFEKYQQMVAKGAKPMSKDEFYKKLKPELLKLPYEKTKKLFSLEMRIALFKGTKYEKLTLDDLREHYQTYFISTEKTINFIFPTEQDKSKMEEMINCDKLNKLQKHTYISVRSAKELNPSFSLQDICQTLNVSFYTYRNAHTILHSGYVPTEEEKHNFLNQMDPDQLAKLNDFQANAYAIVELARSHYTSFYALEKACHISKHTYFNALKKLEN